MKAHNPIVEILVAVLGSLIVVGLASLPLFHAGLFPTMDNISIVRLQSMATQLVTGQFPVRYSSDLAHGHGYGLFNYYAPLPFYAGSLIHLIGINVVGALKRSYFIALIFAACGMAGLSNAFFGPLGAAISVALFVFAPYVGYDIYWRGDVGEAWAMSLVPWVLWFVFRAMKQAKRWDAVIAGFWWSMVILSHTLTAYMASAFLLFWTVVWCRYMRKSVWIPISILAVSFGLSAFFWLPVAVTRGQIWVMYLQATKADMLTGTVSRSIRQLLFPSFIPAITNWFTLLVPLIGCVVVMKYCRTKLTRFVVYMALGLFLFAGIMASSLSGFLWDKLFPVLYMFQFPWRFLTMLTVFGAFLSGGIALAPQKYRYVIMTIFVAAAIFVNWHNFRPRSYEFVDRYVAEDPCGTSWGFEYLPTSIKTCLKTTWEKPYHIEAGDIRILSFHEFPRQGELTVQASTSGVLQWGRYYSSGWEARIDGKVTDSIPSYPYGLVEISIPSGTHRIVFRLQSTPLQRVSNGVSLFTFIGVVTFLGIELWKKFHR